MRLLARFNIILLVILGAGLAFIVEVAYHFLMADARQQVLQQAKLMMESARATRDYTSTRLKPLLQDTPEHLDRFLPETVPAFAAVTSFSYLRNTYPEYSYREPALNPTNPQDRAVDWEADIVNYFKDHNGQTEIVGERDTPTGRSMYLAHPLAAAKPCLECHSTPEAAPATMLRTYGPDNGFGWKENDVVAAQIVSVPMSVPVQIANRAFRTLVSYLAAIFAITMAVIDAALYLIVIRPVRRLSAAADRISKGDMAVSEVPVNGRDEIAAVTGSFNRMYVSLRKALDLLGGE